MKTQFFNMDNKTNGDSASEVTQEHQENKATDEVEPTPATVVTKVTTTTIEVETKPEKADVAKEEAPVA